MISILRGQIVLGRCVSARLKESAWRDQQTLTRSFEVVRWCHLQRRRTRLMSRTPPSYRPTTLFCTYHCATCPLRSYSLAITLLTMWTTFSALKHPFT